MSFFEIFMIGVGLSMDAFAVAICKGLNMRKLDKVQTLVIAFFFGGFQALMPFVGWLLGKQFEAYITSFDHWIAFVLLVLIGANMIREALSKEEAEEANASLAFKTMLLMAVATSIDALAVGITFAFLSVHIVPAALTIGATTFLLSAAGVKVGSVFGLRYKKRAEIAGGVILCLLGVKILLEHLGVL